MFSMLAGQALEKEPAASDLYLFPGQPPSVKVNGQVNKLTDLNVVTEEMVSQIARSEMSKRGIVPREDGPPPDSLDVSITTTGGIRWRVNIYRCGRTWRMVGRRLSESPPTLAELGFGGKENIFAHPAGLVIIAGPPGAGKSTTMAAAASHLLSTQPVHLVSAEEPIEYLIPPGLGIVSQREVGTDCKDFNAALEDALRQTPKIIILGEMRDPESAATALRAAETGQLVLTTVHAHDLEEAVSRIVDLFSGQEAERIRRQLAATLRLLIVQRLVQRTDGGVKMIFEGVTGSVAVLKIIREGRERELKNEAKGHGYEPIEKQLQVMVAMGEILELELERVK